MSRGSITPRRRPDGGIIKDKQGRISWLLKADAPRDPVTGERAIKYRTVRAKTKGEAQKELTKLLRDIDTDEHIDRDLSTFRTYADAWLQDVAPLKAKAGRTRARYGELLRQYVYPTMGHIKVQKVSAAMLDRLYATLLKNGGRDGRALSGRTVHHVHRLLSEILRKAVRARVLTANPCDSADAPVPDDPLVQAFKPAEVETILAALDGHDMLPVVRLALILGARRGELAGLRWGDLDFDRHTVTIQRSIEKVKRIVDVGEADKSRWQVWVGQSGVEVEPVVAPKATKTAKSVRSIRLADSAMAMLKDHQRRQAEVWLKLGVRITSADYVFPATPTADHRQGESPRPIDPDRLTQNFANLLQRVGLKRRGVSFHSLRHTNVSTLLWRKVDDKVVSRRVGHSTTKMTRERYQHIVDEMADDAAEIASTILDPVIRKPPA